MWRKEIRKSYRCIILEISDKMYIRKVQSIFESCVSSSAGTCQQGKSLLTLRRHLM